MENLLNLLVDNYDLSDIINQTVIFILFLLLIGRLPLRIKLHKKVTYY